MNEQSFFLGLPNDIKLKLIKEAQTEDINMFLRLLKIVLDAPLSEGGISSSVIENFLET